MSDLNASSESESAEALTPPIMCMSVRPALSSALGEVRLKWTIFSQVAETGSLRFNQLMSKVVSKPLW